MLRPDRRTRRALTGAFVTVTVLALIWPASIVSGHGSSTGAVPAASANAHSSTSKREPVIHGLGVKPLKANRHEKRTKPLQQLTRDWSGRGTDTTGSRGLQAGQAVDATPPAAVQVTSNGAAAPQSYTPWEGINQAQSTFEPPDPWVAVGPNDVVQTVNTRIRFRNREGGTTAADVYVYDFFAFADLKPGDPNYIDGIGDPRFIYDARHDRWLGITLAWHCDGDGTGPDESIGFVWGAISTSGDPTGDYYQFYGDYKTYLPDFPGLGTSADKFAITANEYVLPNSANCTAGTLQYDGGSVFSFDWAQMLTFPEKPVGSYQLSPDWFALRAALAPQSTSNTIFVIGEQLLSAPLGDTTSNVVYMTVTGVNNSIPGASFSAPLDLTAAGVVPPFVDPPAPRQPGGTLDPDIIDRRPTDAIWQNNVLTFASTRPCDPAGGAVETRDCGRVTQINTSTATPTRVQDMLLATQGKDTWFPGMGQTALGTLHVEYTQSGPTEGMSSYDRYQLPTSAKHTLSLPTRTALGGTLAYPGVRWGDFVGVAQDPRDTSAVWQGNQYTKSDGTWGTRISEMRTQGATYVPVAPVRLLDSRAGRNIGLTGPFLANQPRSVDIAGRGGIPANAVGITGNLTIVNQTYQGYASLTPTPTANPTTATLNFPKGDLRGNNLTSPLGPNGAVSIVYKAPNGSRADFVLDVTGYFLNTTTGATYKKLAPVRIVDSRPAKKIGLANALTSDVPVQFQARGVFGIPLNATAVVGNLAVTGQTSGGYVSLSSTPPAATPATSTVNFPVGDTRANGITIKLSSGGTIYAVFKGLANATAHLIFDVNGYYVQDLTGARFVPLVPGRRMDTRFAAPPEGITGAFVHATPKTLIVEPYQGVPNDAVAVTGNLTVVNPSAAGYVSMTPTAGFPPPNSTLNFPAHDVRGNGVTSPESDAGSVAFVYVAAGGQSTHLVFDVTGYFR